MGCQIGLIKCFFQAICSDPKVFSNGIIVFDDPKEFDDFQVSDSLNLKAAISN